MLNHVITKKIFKNLEKLEHGQLSMTTPDGMTRTFSGRKAGYIADITLHDWCVFKNIMLKGDIGFAEDYQSGKWDSSDIKQLVCLILDNRSALDQYAKGNLLISWITGLSYFFNRNSIKGSKKNIHAHYDLGNEFYSLWLDPSMTYSSALFEPGKDSLEFAQDSKYDRIIERLNQSTGDLLEIGCGWGGFAERCLEKQDRNISGITLSEQQHNYATNRLQNDAKIQLQDYRHQTGKFDNIVSIEMFEAVGEKYWKTYFAKIKNLLKQKGNAVIQTITMNESDYPRYRRSSDFIRSYIFPGGMLPSPDTFKNQATQAGLKPFDDFRFGQDYAKTLDKWLVNFDSKAIELSKLGFDDSFKRLWRFYLAACSAGFETKRTDVMQIQLCHA